MNFKSAEFFKKTNLARWPNVLYAACLGIFLLSIGASATSPAPPSELPTDSKKPAVASAEELAKLRATIDVKIVHPGQTFNLVLIFDIQPQWHIYWKNPGEGAPPPDVVVQVPDGYKVGKIRWPRPIEMDSPIGPEYVYEKQAALFVPITAPEKLSDGQIEIIADVRWAVCKHICLWGQETQTIKLATSSSRELKSKVPQIDPEIKKLSKRLPTPLKNIKSSYNASAYFDGSKLSITGPAHGFSNVKFFPGFTPGVTYLDPQALIQNDRFTVTVEIKINRLNSLGKPIVLEGLIALGSKLDDPSYDFQVPVPKK